MNKKLLMLLMLSVAAVQARVGDDIKQYTHQYGYNPDTKEDGLVVTLLGNNKRAEDLRIVSSIVSRGAGVASNVESFIGTDIAQIEQNGRKLAQVVNNRSLNPNQKLAAMLKALQELVVPIISKLIAQESKGKGTGWDSGTFLQLTSIFDPLPESILSAKNKALVTEFQKNIITMANSLASAFGFAGELADELKKAEDAKQQAAMPGAPQPAAPVMTPIIIEMDPEPAVESWDD